MWPNFFKGVFDSISLGPLIQLESLGEHCKISCGIKGDAAKAFLHISGLKNVSSGDVLVIFMHCFWVLADGGSGSIKSPLC